VQRIVREERAIFGEFPAYEGNTYTFIADYLPWDSSDGMEHRNSTALTSPLAIPTGRADLLDAIAHEFFHCWNVERIRPKSLEPFDLEDVNMSGELWLAEGFTSYYGPLALKRAGLTTLTDFTADISEAVDTVLTSGARQVRTAEEMSRYAPFFDDATAIDPTAMERTFISYYAWGQGIALGLDLSLRERTNGRITLDDFMRAMWEQFGRPGGRLAGYVDHPYTIDDARAVLAAVSGDASFAQDFFSRYIQGHAAVDYAGLLARAGLVLTKAAPGRAFADVRLGDAGNGARITEAVQFDSPVYRAGLDRDDVIVEAGGSPIRSAADFTRIIEAHRPGDALRVVVDRRGGRVAATVTLVENPHSRIVPVEETGVAVTEDQKHFRDNWLSSAARNGF
jgi:predicted metalloprotease with PDZ domain